MSSRVCEHPGRADRPRNARRSRSRMCGAGHRRGRRRRPRTAPGARGSRRRGAGHRRRSGRPRRRDPDPAGEWMGRTHRGHGEAGVGARRPRPRRGGGTSVRSTGRRADGWRDRRRERSAPHLARGANGTSRRRCRRHGARVPLGLPVLDARRGALAQPGVLRRRARQRRDLRSRSMPSGTSGSPAASRSCSAPRPSVPTTRWKHPKPETRRCRRRCRSRVGSVRPNAPRASPGSSRPPVAGTSPPGKIVDLVRRTEGGFARGTLTVEGTGDDAGRTLHDPGAEREPAWFPNGVRCW